MTEARNERREQGGGSAGRRNFLNLYQPLANTWRVYDNTRAEGPVLIAKGTLHVENHGLWQQFQKVEHGED